MKYTDKRYSERVLFNSLEVGDCFDVNDFVYIKILDNLAFNIINNKIENFGEYDIVSKRKAEIIFY